MSALPGLLLAMLATVSLAYGAENGYTRKSIDLKDDMATDANTVATLPEKTVVEILERRGAWMRIKAPGAKAGWVKMLSVNLGSPDQKPQAGDGNLLSSLGLGSKSRPTGSSQVTAGVRGFSEEDLNNAKPNPAEVEKMKGFSATRDEAVKVAESGKLAARALPYFDENGKPLKEKK